MRLLVTLLVSVLLSSAAFAQQMPSDWRIDLGTTVISAPDFPGAEERRLLVVPYWDVEYRDLWFSKGLDFAGVNLVRGERWKSGAALTWDFDGRDEEDAPELAGLGNVDGTLRAKLFTAYRRGLVTFTAEASQDVLGNGHGLTGTAGVTVAMPFWSPWFFAVSPGISWVDEENAATFFGVDPEQSEASGYPVYEAEAGLRNARLSLLASRKLNDDWTATGIVSARRLLGDAASSPLTPRDGEMVFVVTVARRIR